MGELEPLLDGFDICGGVFSGERGIGIQVKIWRKRWPRPVAIMEAENP